MATQVTQVKNGSLVKIDDAILDDIWECAEDAQGTAFQNKQQYEGMRRADRYQSDLEMTQRVMDWVKSMREMNKEPK